MVVVLACLVTAGLAIAIALLLLSRRARQVEVPAVRPTEPLPIVLVHGFLGFDEVRLLGQRAPYFRGVRRALEELGLEVHVVRLPAMASVADRAAVLVDRIRALDRPRVNLIAHSMGGVDARYALSRLGLRSRVAALVTIGTPHRGTPLARVGDLFPVALLRAALGRMGVRAEASEWLTPERMAAFNLEVPDAPDVYYASVIGRPGPAGRTNLPLRTGRRLLDRGGTSDGVVPVASQAWGEVLFEADADHFAQIGWSVERDARPIYLAIAEHLRARDMA